MRIKSNSEHQSKGIMALLNQVIQLSRRQSRTVVFTCLMILAVTFVYHQHQGLFDAIDHQSPKVHHDECRRVLNKTDLSSGENSKTYISSLCNCGKEIVVENESAIKSGEFKWCSDESTIRGPHQKIVTYSLYGNVHNASIFKRYFSLLRNISLAVEKDYPGWIVRIYHNIRDREGPEREAHNSLCDVYCRFNHVDLCSVPLLADRIGNETTPIDPKLLLGLNPKMFRYLVMLDPNVDIFISRDVDSPIFRREVDAVEQWLASNYTFHLMRDNTYHGSVILAGMWGAKVHQRRDLIEGLMRALVLSGQNQNRGQDQASLADIIWPAAKFDVMAHDSYQCEVERIKKTSPVKIFPFPTKREGGLYVGGAGYNLYADKCPLACRPPDHQDWEYC